MRRFFIGVLFFTLVSLGLSNAQAADAPKLDTQKKPDLSTPEAAVRSFVAALTLHNVEHALACVYKANTRNRTELVKRMQFGEKNKESYSIVDVDIVTADVPHRAFGTVRYTFKRAKTDETPAVEFQVEEPLLLARPEQDWKILSRDANYAWGAAQGGFLQMEATLIAHPEVYEAAPTCQLRIESLASNVLWNLPREFAGKFAVKQKTEQLKTETPEAARWSLLKRAIVPYFTENMGRAPQRMFHCPADGDDYEKESYSFNEKLDGVAVTEIAEPANTVLIYEGKDGQLNFRHDCRASVAFADGHVELINEEQSKTLRWTP